MTVAAAEWTDVYVASAGAAAALAGLVFVAVSINVERILSYRGLPERGLVTVLVLLGAVIVSLFGLKPEQSSATLGVELLLAGGLMTAIVLWLLIKSRPRQGEKSYLPSALLLGLLGTVPYVVAGGLLLTSSDGAGRDWLFAGIIAAIIAGVVSAWVLLVEILR